jgi:hypothetical protein
MDNEIIFDINKLNEYENISKTNYSVYYEDNILLNLINNKYIINQIILKSQNYINNKNFIKNIKFYTIKFASFDFKQTILKNSYQMSIDKEISIDDSFDIYYNNISNEDIIKIAYFTLISYYIINKYN